MAYLNQPRVKLWVDFVLLDLSHRITCLEKMHCISTKQIASRLVHLNFQLVFSILHYQL